jgi:hypothetical protein
MEPRSQGVEAMTAESRTPLPTEREALDRLLGMYSTKIKELETDLAEMTKERDHWKANHADMVQRNAVLSQRPDLPVDRLPAIAKYESIIAALKSQAEQTKPSFWRKGTTFAPANPDNPMWKPDGDGWTPYYAGPQAEQTAGNKQHD